jgi:hypothetical protein
MDNLPVRGYFDKFYLMENISLAAALVCLFIPLSSWLSKKVSAKDVELMFSSFYWIALVSLKIQLVFILTSMPKASALKM